MSVFKIVLLVSFSVLILYSALTYAANSKVERQKYRLVKTINDVEFRFYPKVIMASVASGGATYLGNSNNHFRTLAGYIFGGNKKDEKIAMTAPVHMAQNDKGSEMSFVMPGEYDMDKLPQPKDSLVKLHYSVEGYYAALKFGGYANENKVTRKIEELKTALAAMGYTTIGSYTYLGYNAPWDVINRENEIIVQIEFTE
jgi:hypothetical protein